MALQPFRYEQLNYFRFAFLVINEFPKALRQAFSTMWDNNFGHLTGYQRWDDTTAVRNLFLSTEGGKTRVPINLSFDEWDCTALFQATIYARTFASPDSKGHPRTLSQLYVSKLPHGKFHVSVESPGGNDAETFSLAIDQLRLLRNSLCHSPSSKIDKMTFDQWVQHAKDAFKALGVETDPVEAIGRLTDADFPTEKVRALEEDIRKASQAENQFLREEVKDRLLDVRSDTAQSIQQLQDSHKRTETERKKEVQSLNDKLQLVKEELKEEIRNTMEKSKEKSEEKPAVNQEVTGRTTLGAEEITRSYLPPKVPPLAGRQKECDEIIGHLSSGCTRIVSIWGSPGFGKTSVAISVGDRLLTQGWPVYFVSLRGLQSKADLTSKLLSFLKHSATNDQLSQRLSLDDELCRLFAKISFSPGPFVLILDNTDELLERDVPDVKEEVIHLLEEILRRNESVKFVVTTRESFEFMNVRLQGHHAVRIRPLDDVSSKKLVRDLLPNASTIDCLRIAQLCGHVPLALKLSCSLISGDDALSVSQCLRDFIKSSGNITELLDNPDYPSSQRLKSLFESSFKRLSEQEKESLVSLCILPENFDLKAAAAVLGKTNEIEAKGVLQSLRRRSLLDSSSRPESFSMHTLIQSFTREKGEREMEQTFLKSKARFCEFYISLFEKLNNDFLTGQSVSAYEKFYEEKQSIIQSLTESCSDSKTADRVFDVLVKAELFLDSLFWLLSEAANFNKIYDSAVEAARDLGKNVFYRRLLVSRAFSEVTWSRRGKTMELLSEAEKIQATSSSVTDGEKGKRLCYLGFYQLVIGQTQNGVQCLQEPVSLMDNNTEGTILRIIVFQVLTVYYQFKKDSINSADFCSKALQECRTLRGTHAHLLVIPAMQSMRTTRTDESKRSSHINTVTLLNQPIQLQITFLVREVTKHFAHVDIDKSLGNFVLIMLNDIETELGNRAPLGLFSLHRMVVIMLGIFSKSEDARIVIARERISYHRAALEQCKQNSSERNDKENPARSCEMHKDALAKSYLDLGFAQRDKEDFDSALQSEQRALEIRLEQFGEEHSSIADCYHSLGATQYAKGDFPSSLHSTQRALAIRRKLYGEEHPSTAYSHYFLGNVQHKLHEFSSALQSKQRALDIELKLFGDENSSTADSYFSLGVTQHEVGDITAALESQQRALDIKLKLFREEQFNSLDGYYSLGIKENEMGDYSSDRTEWLDILDYK